MIKLARKKKRPLFSLQGFPFLTATGPPKRKQVTVSARTRAETTTIEQLVPHEL